MEILRSILLKLSRRPKDGAVELIRIQPVPLAIGPDAWSTRMIVLGATPIRGPKPIDLDLIRERLARHMVELDWEMAIEEDTLRQAARDVMPEAAPSRARGRL